MKAINFLIKPASSLCNLRCRYCFYEDESENRSVKNMGIMTQDTVDLLLKRSFGEIETGGIINFAFQGGEPTAAGLDFFKEFTRKAEERRPGSISINYSIQTNGTMIDEEWAEFLKKHRFLVGISIDGNKDIHDMNRVDANGRGSYNLTMNGLRHLWKAGADVNALCVVTKNCARSPEKVYRALKKSGFSYMQFIACLDPIERGRGSMPYSLTPGAYGEFLRGLFDVWYRDIESGDIRSIRLFDDYLAILAGEDAGTCSTCGRCGAYFVIEADGSVYPCDFFVLDEWRMGNLRDMSLSELAESPAAVSFLEWGRKKPSECADCRFGRICRGGCKNDWYTDASGEHNYYCESFKSTLDYICPRLVKLADFTRRRTGTHYIR